MTMAVVLATIVDTRALAETVAASVIAGVGITVVFSVAIFGAVRFAELGREGRNAAAALYGIVAVVGIIAFAAAIVIGIVVMTAK